MSEEEIINVNEIREDLYQAMQIGDITLNSKNSQKLYDFMNFQDKEIERLNEKIDNLEKLNNANYRSFIEVNNIRNKAIEYIKENTSDGYVIVDDLNYYDIPELLRILEGSDKE